MARLGEANIGGRLVPAWLLDLTAEELDGLKWNSNPNLLDNWYFGNPVNQRGQTEYLRSGYTIDRWILQAINYGALTVNNEYVSLSAKNNDGLLQKVPASKLISGHKYTMSVLTDVGLLSKTITLTKSVSVYSYDNSIWSFVVGKSDDVWLVYPLVMYNQSSAQSINAKAAKLELGPQQTLAHQDTGGGWVLNEIPDYGEQLRRCQRYFVNFNPYKMAYFTMPPAVASSTTQAYSGITLPVAMRAQPVVSYGGRIYLSQTGDIEIVDMAVSENTFTGIAVQLRYGVASGLTQNSLYRVQGGADTTSYIHLSADL